MTDRPTSMGDRTNMNEDIQSFISRLSCGIDCHRQHIMAMERLKERRHEYLSEVKVFAKELNLRLFTTILSLDDMLKAKSFGYAKIDFDDVQDNLYTPLDPSSGNRRIKRFSGLTARIEISIGDKNPAPIKGAVTFCYTHGNITWDAGDTEYFLSEREKLRDGSLDVFDLLAMTHAIPCPKVGPPGTVPKDPFEIIKYRISTLKFPHKEQVTTDMLTPP